MKRKANKKVIDAINQELNTDNELDLLATSNAGKNFVISSNVEQRIGGKKFFSAQKVRIIVASTLYSALFFFLVLSYSLLVTKNLSTFQKGQLNIFHTAVTTTFTGFYALLGIFPIFWLKMDKKNPMDLKSFLFHIFNIIPLFLIPLSNFLLPITDNASIKLHSLITATCIFIQGIMLGGSMVFVNARSKKRYPVLSRKTISFWTFFIAAFVMPLGLWITTNQLNIANSFNKGAFLFIFIAMFMLLTALFVALAIYISNKHFIFYDKMISATSQLSITILFFMVGGSIGGLGASFIDFKLPFAFTTTFVISIIVIALLLIGYLAIIIINFRRLVVHKNDPLTNSILFNCFIVAGSIVIIFMSLFTKVEELSVQPIYPYLILTLGIYIYILVLINNIFEVNLILINSKTKIIILAIIVVFTGFTSVLISSLEDAAIIKSLYSLNLDIFALGVIFLLFSLLMITNMVIIALSKSEKKTLNKAEILKKEKYMKLKEKELKEGIK